MNPEPRTDPDLLDSVAVDDRSVRLELLRPAEIERALANGSIVYVPLGTIEWHSHHLPVGLDGLTAHGVCLRAAAGYGGLVYPPLYVGTGGGHRDYPWTVMLPDPAPIVTMVELVLRRLADFGVRTVVLFSGHFADEQLSMIAGIARRWNVSSANMRVVAYGINQIEGLGVAPDHAGVFETTMLNALWPDRVAIDELAELDPLHPVTDDWDDARHGADHPLRGVFGPDPRRFDPTASAPMLRKAARWLAVQADRP
jgi:creatinine amidohydrolase